jgi:hypothetical protein
MSALRIARTVLVGSIVTYAVFLTAIYFKIGEPGVLFWGATGSIAAMAIAAAACVIVQIMNLLQKN